MRLQTLAPLWAALAACSPVGPAGSSDEDSVRAAEQAQLAAYRARDAGSVVAGYAPDAAVIVAGQPPAVGLDSIRAAVERITSDPAFSISLENRKTAVGGDLAYTRGLYRITYSEPGSGRTAHEEGQYLTVFRRQPDGSWKVAEDVAARGATAKAG